MHVKKNGFIKLKKSLNKEVRRSLRPKVTSRRLVLAALVISTRPPTRSFLSTLRCALYALAWHSRGAR